MMIKMYLTIIGLMLTACPHSTSQSMPVNPPVKTADNRLVSPAPTPPAPLTLSECSQKRTVGLPSGVDIPQELCFDDTKAVDTKEKSSAKTGNSPQSSQISGADIKFAELPKEVQSLVRLTVPEMDVNAVVFDLTIIPTPDAKANNRLVKSYSYGSSSKNKAAGKDPNHHSWLFKRQNNLLKLEYAEIDTTK